MTAARTAGERSDAPERVIVSPADGRYHPRRPDILTDEGEIIHAGQVIGDVERSGVQTPVSSPFTGFFMGVMADAGELVRPGQPVAWLRATG
ncbi:hypothetical protein BH20ACT2_BH20ACT2_01420 [soil metagenome]